MTLIIKNGTLINADQTMRADLLIENERIAAVGETLEIPFGAEVIDAEGMDILPGGVDVHVHLDLPMFNTVSSDNHYTGTKAAAFGGTTTVIDFTSQNSDDLVGEVNSLREKADPKVAIDYSLHMNITHLTDEVERQIPLLVANGVTSIKVFTAYNHRLRLQDDEIFRVMRIAARNGILTMLHAENGDVIEILVREALEAGRTDPIWHARTRPAWGAAEAVCRGASLSAMADAPLYVVHVNAGGEVDQLEYARLKGVRIFAETCPQYLLFTDEELARPEGAKWICSPPLRTHLDNDRIWEGLSTHVIDTIATDHCPFFFNGQKPIIYEGQRVRIPGKELGVGDFTKIPNGLPGVGDRLPVLWTEMIQKRGFSKNDFVRLTSTNPAKLFGLFPRKGVIKPGSDADLVVWDPSRKVRYGLAHCQHRTDHNLYEGFELEGFPKMVFLRGSLIVDRGTWMGAAGQGKFIKRNQFGDPKLEC
jgi:dihydropyrimidinase